MYPNTAPLQLSSRTSAGCAGSGTDLAECVSTAGDFFRPSGAVLEVFTPFGGLGLLPGAWGSPNKGNADGAVGIFDHAGRVWAPTLQPDPPKKALCHTRPVGETEDKYRCILKQHLSSCRVALRPAMLAASLIRPGVSRHWRFPPASGGCPPRLLTPLEGVGFITWRLRHPY